MWRTPATLRGLARRRARAARTVAVVILALETSCDDTCAAVVDRRRRDRCVQRDLLAGRARPLRRRRAGGRLAPPPRARQRRWSTTRCAAPGRRSTTSTLVAVTRGPGLVGALLVGLATAKGARRRPRGCRSRRSTTCRATSPRASSSPTPLEPPFLCLIASGGHTLLAEVRRPRRLRAARRRRSTTRRARRSTRARGCSACPTRAARRWSAWPPTGDPERVRRSRRRAGSRGLDFSFAGLKTVAAVPAPRPRGGGGRAPARRPGRRPTSARSSRRWRCASSAALEQTGLRAARPRRRRGRQRPAARARSPRSAAEVAVPPPELCTDNAAMIASAARFGRAAALPGLPGPRRLRHRRARP